MLDFANPLFLLLIPAAPLVVWRWLKRPRRALRFSDTRPFQALAARSTRIATWTGAALRALILLLLIAALAGPRWPDPRTRIATEGIAIQLVLDNSGSMAEPDFTWEGKPASRLDAVKKVLRLFVAGGQDADGRTLIGRSNDVIGLVTFATWPETRCPPTLSHRALLESLDHVQPWTVPTESRTNIGDAIAWGLHRLAGAPTTRKVILLVSDGEHNVPPPALTPRQAAQLAANLRIPIYAIDAGGDTDGTGSEPRSAGHHTAAEIRENARMSMLAIARMTGGKYFRARETENLLAVCDEIDRLERSQVQSFLYRSYYQVFPWIGLTALGLYFALLLLESTLWLRVP